MLTDVLGAAFLIAGTSIGAGMLALPIKTAAAGFFPTIAMFIVVWCIMVRQLFRSILSHQTLEIILRWA